MLRKLLSHAAIYGLAAQVPRLAGVVALPIITRYLTTTDYGVAGVVTAYVAALGMLQSLGLSIVMVNSFARYPLRYKWIWRQLNGFISIWTLLYGVLLGVVLYFAVPAAADQDRLQIALLYCLPAMFFTGTDMQAGLFYQLSQRPLPIAFRSFIVGTASVGLNIFFIAYMRLGYMGWFYSQFLAAVINFLINSYSVYVKQQLWPILHFKWSRIKSALRIALPVLPHGFFVYLLDISDRLVLDVLQVPLSRIGLYNIAASFGSYFMIATGAIMQAASPYYMQFYGKKSTIEAALQARRLTFVLQGLFLLATFIGALWMKEIFQLLIKNEALQKAYPLAIIILMGYNFRPMYVAVTNLLVYREYTSKLWKVSVIAGAGNVLLNFILVPVYGYEVAAFTTFAALMYLGYSGFFLKEYKQLAQVNYYPLIWLFVTILALGVVYSLAAVALFYKAIITAFSGIVVLVLYIFLRKYKVI